LLGRDNSQQRALTRGSCAISPFFFKLPPLSLRRKKNKEGETAQAPKPLGGICPATLKRTAHLTLPAFAQTTQRRALSKKQASVDNGALKQTGKARFFTQTHTDPRTIFHGFGFDFNKKFFG
jgi:hypothetical protein